MTDSTTDKATWLLARLVHPNTATQNGAQAGFSSYDSPEGINLRKRVYINKKFVPNKHTERGVRAEEPILHEFAEKEKKTLALSPLIISGLDPREGATADTSICAGAYDLPDARDGGWNLWSEGSFPSDGLATGEVKCPSWDMNVPMTQYMIQNDKQVNLWRRPGGYLISSEVPAGRRNTWFIPYDHAFFRYVMRRSRRSARYLDAGLPHPKHVCPWQKDHLQKLINARFNYHRYKTVECKKYPCLKPLAPERLPPPRPYRLVSHYRQASID